MRGLKLLFVLALSLTMTACLTRTTGQIAAEADADLIRRICQGAWTPAEYDSIRDTIETVEGNRALNRSRAAFCND